MAAITSPHHPGERLDRLLQSDLPRERARKREDLLAATKRTSPSSQRRFGAPASRCAAKP